jgi:hypothetical protein
MSWKVSVAVLLVLMKQNLMFALCTIITNCHYDLQGKNSVAFSQQANYTDRPTDRPPLVGEVSANFCG